MVENAIVPDVGAAFSAPIIDTRLEPGLPDADVKEPPYRSAVEA
jgi:hypothetical protein